MSIYVWPVGSAELVQHMNEIPGPRDFIGAWDGYRFYLTDKGKYAIEE